MPKSAFKRRRTGFTLIEVLLASVAGTAVLMALAYTSREMAKAVEAVHNEAYLQTVARELELNLDATVPVAFSTYVNAHPAGEPVPITMSKYTARPTPGAYAYAPLGLGAQAAFMMAKQPTPTPSPTQTPTPGANPTSTSDADAVDQTAEMALDSFRMLFQLDADGLAANGGTLLLTRDGALGPAVPIGSRGMIADTRFAYGDFQPPVPDHDTSLDYSVDEDIAKKMLRVTTTFGKGDMVPFYLQATYAPRTTSWAWSGEPTLDPTVDYDGDGSVGPDDPTPWGGEVPHIPNGLMPMLISEGQMVGKSVGDTINAFDGASNYGYDSAQKGWTTWEAGSADANYLKDAIDDPGSKVFTNPLDPSDHSLGLEDNVWPNTGNSTTGEHELGDGAEVVVLVWDTFDPDTGYHVVGFAKIQLNDKATWDQSHIYATFKGWCDAEGNMVEDLSAVGEG